LRLIIFRHGIAEDPSAPDSPPDPDRALTKKGRRRVKAAARGLAALGIEPQYVFSSPYRRAIETGEIASKVLTKSKTTVLAIDELLPDRHPREFLRVIRDLNEGDVVCTGHVPHLDILTANCLGSVAMFTALDKAGAACIEFPPERPRGNLLWFMNAKSLRMLGKG
jgi:phosphohistidine phosphatase